MPDYLAEAIKQAYRELCRIRGKDLMPTIMNLIRKN